MWKKVVCAVTALFILAFPLSALAYARNEIIMKGDRDRYVLELQKALRAKGFLRHKATGYFGTDTLDAVIAFQKKKGLKADGKAGPVTRKALLGSAYKPIKEKRDVKDKSIDKLYPGDKGDDVRDLQQRLKALGYYKYSKITGYYGPSTKTAVTRCQRTNGLKMDGIAGPDTRKLLESGKAKYYTIYYKDKGADVEDMQERLKKLGYLKEKASGYFGASTLAALKGFQQANGLKDDGKAGRDTLKKLYSGNAKKAGKNYKPPKIVKEVGGKTKIEKLINFAKTHVGKRYRRGAEGPNTFDCSGFVQYCMKYVGVKLPRTSGQQSKVAKYKKINALSDLKAGDLMFFKTSSSSAPVHHSGIYIGGNKFIHSAPRVGVQIRTLTKGSYYYRQFRWGRRVF